MDKLRAALFLLIAPLACTAPNPNFVGSSGDGGSGARADLAGLDLGGVDLSARDLAAECSGDQRACLSMTASAGCVAGSFALDRKCPMASMCMTGFCRPPATMNGSLVGVSCSPAGSPQENVCFSSGSDTLSCQPFINPQAKSVGWFCDAAVGAGLPGTTCTQGSDCRSGFCGSNGTCFRACQSPADCPIDANTNMQFNCSMVQITVEGQKISADSCVP